MLSMERCRTAQILQISKHPYKSVYVSTNTLILIVPCKSRLRHRGERTLRSSILMVFLIPSMLKQKDDVFGSLLFGLFSRVVDPVRGSFTETTTWNSKLFEFRSSNFKLSKCARCQTFYERGQAAGDSDENRENRVLKMSPLTRVAKIRCYWKCRTIVNLFRVSPWAEPTTEYDAQRHLPLKSGSMGVILIRG